MSETTIDTAVTRDRRLDEIAWGAFLAVMGGLLLVPEETLPRGLWLIAIGVILVGVNVARYLGHIKVKGFVTVLGVFALAAGVTALLGVQLPLFAILLIVVGGAILFRPLFRRPAA